MRLTDGECWRASRSPEGPVTLHLTLAGRTLVAEAWGPGAAWAVEHVPGLVGLDDDAAGFRPRHPVVRELHRRHPGLRLLRTGAVAEALVPAVLEQKVVGLEARRSFRWLVGQVGEAAPGPGGLTLPPSPAALAATPSWTFHRAGVERRRADTVRRAMTRAVRLEETVTMPLPDAYRRLRAFPGVGAWTAAEVASVALGDPDAVSVGDYHLPALVSWALAGEPDGDDDRLLELLEPYRGHRARVVRLLETGGVGPPRRGPRLPLRRIAAS
jgi:3-methyladenine DNA glycosylase/8-oxoguanine DNA glycosylase